MVLRSTKFLVTCEHVVRDSVCIIVHPSAGEPLRILTADFTVNTALDIAVVRAPQLPFAHFQLYLGDLKLGCPLQALGYPLDYTEPLAIHSACSLGGVRNRGTAQAPVRALVVSGGGINPGYSGGPLTFERPNDTTVWLLGIIRRAPDRFGYLRPALDALVSQQTDIGLLAKLIDASPYVGISEAVAHQHVLEVLEPLAPIM